MRVLVTNGDTRPALAITRSLGGHGHEVIVASDRMPSLASASRHCTAAERYPEPDLGAGSFIDALAEIATRRNVDLLLPVTEIATTLVSAHRARLPAGCAVVLPPDRSLLVANDKARTLALAAELGVPIPRTCVVASAAEAIGRSDLRYPVVVKPARSRVPTGRGWISGGVDYAADPATLGRKLAALPAELFPVLLQERIVGPGIGVFACCQDGRPVAMFSHQRLREKPPSGGVSVLAESVAVDPGARVHAEALLAQLGWHGVAMVEFKRDLRDGALKLMEINGRFWGSLQLAIDAGVDFPALVARIAAGERLERLTGYKAGVRTRWVLGDVDALVTLLTRGHDQLQLPDDHPGRCRSLWQVLKPWQPGVRNEMFRAGDRGPGWFEIRRWLSGR